MARAARIGAILAVALLLAAGCGRREIKLAQEPELTVVVNPETGEKRTMPVEEYVKGVVGGEMGQLAAAGEQMREWPENAYAAQAILARTFIMEYLARNEGGEITTDVEETQAYRPENITPTIERAVEKTRGEVLTQNGRYVTTWFHSYSGGRTATAAEGLNYPQQENWTKSVELPDNPLAPADRRNWSAAFSLAEVTQALAAKGIDVGTVTGLEVTERGPSGRITQITVTGTGGTRQVHGSEFRLALGAERMLSTLVDPGDFRVEGDRLIVSGRGFGHGVGMSQWDAYKMAEEGRTPEEIVMTFYQNVKIEKRWD